MKRIIPFIILCILITGCSSKRIQRKVAYKTIYAEKPLSILILPPINQSTSVEAKEAFYYTLATPLTERGYYVLPQLTTLAVLKEENAYDSELFVNGSMKQVGEQFGADAVLFTVIHEWKDMRLQSFFRITIEYTIKSTKTDAILFHRTGIVIMQTSHYSITGQTLGRIPNLFSKPMSDATAISNFCNNMAFADIPEGKYGTNYGIDMDYYYFGDSFVYSIGGNSPTLAFENLDKIPATNDSDSVQ